MSEQRLPFIQMVQECEAAIKRIRSATWAGEGHTPEVGEDIEFIRRSTAPIFSLFARDVGDLAPGAKEEAQQAMFEQLQDHIRSPNYPSLETHFGAYLKRTPLRSLQRTRQTYTCPGRKETMARLDMDPRGTGHTLAETIVDPQAETAFDSVITRIVLQDALAQLKVQERQAIVLDAEGYTNNDIANHLAVSPATATRLRQRARAALQRILSGTFE